MATVESSGVERGAVARTRMASLDVVRAFAIFLVVMLHSASPVMYQITSTPEVVWNMHNLIDSAARICVPLFFMVSGYLLLAPTPTNDTEPFRDVRKRLPKLLVPLITWGVIYRLEIAYVNGRWPTLNDVFFALRDMTQGALVYHLWFLYGLAAIYLLLPLLRRLFKDTDRPAIYFFGLWLVLLTGRFLSALTGWGFPLATYLNFASAGYLVAGHLVRRYSPSPSPSLAAIAFAAYVFMVVVTTWMTGLYSKGAGTYIEIFHVYATPNVVIMSVSAFLVLLYAANKLELSSPTLMRFFAGISACSFGIYLVHVLFLEFVSYNILGRPATSAVDAMFGISMTAISTLATCFVATWLLRLTPFTRWLAP
ncbi:acyltransferase family protein [Hyphomicrobium sp. NDB2Meth4]|uniref:acyltransferase n=1 Tax=Hyphomicrobium sp. NDB2Meth4 TaxID=1892846 RepID=UPI0015C54B6C|nr:acyltransferase family protein [Hyphomicrobium sp. NDB2Meth4]